MRERGILFKDFSNGLQYIWATNELFMHHKWNIYAKSFWNKVIDLEVDIAWGFSTSSSQRQSRQVCRGRQSSKENSSEIIFENGSICFWVEFFSRNMFKNRQTEMLLHVEWSNSYNKLPFPHRIILWSTYSSDAE